MFKRTQMKVDNTTEKWIFYMDDIYKCHHFLYIRLVWHSLYPHHHLKCSVLALNLAFWLISDYVYLWELKVVRVQLKMIYKKVLLQHLFCLNSAIGRFVLQTYIKDGRQRKKRLSNWHSCVLPDNLFVCGVSEISRIFTKMLIRKSVVFIFEKLSCFAFLYSINFFFSRFN